MRRFFAHRWLTCSLTSLVANISQFPNPSQLALPRSTPYISPSFSSSSRVGPDLDGLSLEPAPPSRPTRLLTFAILGLFSTNLQAFFFILHILNIILELKNNENIRRIVLESNVNSIEEVVADRGTTDVWIELNKRISSLFSWIFWVRNKTSRKFWNGDVWQEKKETNVSIVDRSEMGIVRLAGRFGLFPTELFIYLKTSLRNSRNSAIMPLILLRIATDVCAFLKSLTHAEWRTAS